MRIYDCIIQCYCLVFMLSVGCITKEISRRYVKNRQKGDWWCCTTISWHCLELIIRISNLFVHFQHISPKIDYRKFSAIVLHLLYHHICVVMLWSSYSVVSGSSTWFLPFFAEIEMTIQFCLEEKIFKGILLVN